jgi:hypothetical protein
MMQISAEAAVGSGTGATRVGLPTAIWEINDVASTAIGHLTARKVGRDNCPAP